MQMAEPSCLVRSFSQPSESSRDFNEGDPARCLGESISFGRYMSEPLAWEKWSTFSNNRYLEEAEKSSKPGSVAKMKAYFEAYYKSIGSRKREAKDEKASRANDMEVRDVVEQVSCSDSDAPQEDDSAFDRPSNEEDSNLGFSSSFAAPENEECRVLGDTGYIAPVNTLDSSVKLEVHFSDDLESCAQLEAHPSDDLENSLQLERQPSNELKCTPEVESSKEGDDLEKLNSKVKSGDSKTERSAISKPPISLEMEPLKKGYDQERLNLKIKKLPDSNSRILPYCKPSKIPKSYGKVVASQPMKEGCVTPRNKQQAKDTLHLKAVTSTSLYKSIKLGPHADLIKKSSRTVQRSLIENPLTPSAKTMKDKATPLQTPNKAPVVGKPKHTSATPRPEFGRSISTPGRSLSRGRAGGQELQPPSLNNMKASTSCGFKARASVTFSPFNFRTEERAAKRREFFLKQQEKEAEKSKQPEKAKEQVNTARKLLHTVGLRAKSAVDSNVRYSRQEICTHPQPRALKQSDTLKLKDGKNDLPRYQSTSLSKKIRHENASPNIL